MSKLSKFVTAALLGLNALVLAFVLSAVPVSAGGVDDCDENDPEGCDCLEASQWFPAGCYKAGGTTFVCQTGGDCDDPAQN